MSEEKNGFKCPGCAVVKPNKELGEIAQVATSGGGLLGSTNVYAVKCPECSLTYFLSTLYGQYTTSAETVEPDTEEPVEEPISRFAATAAEEETPEEEA